MIWKGERGIARCRLASVSPGRPEQRLIFLIDGDPIAIGIGHREGPPEWPVKWLGEDRYPIRRHLLKECLSVAGPPPQWMLVVSGDGPGRSGRRAEDSANVGQPTKTAESGPKSRCRAWRRGIARRRWLIGPHPERRSR